MREHLESLAKQAARSGKPPPDELDGPDCPECAAHVWGWFCEVARRRTNSGFGLNPVSYGELTDWARLTCTRPSAMEVEWIMALDDAQAAATAERSLAQQGGQKREKPK